MSRTISPLFSVFRVSVCVALGVALAVIACHRRRGVAAAEETFIRPTSYEIAESIFAHGRKPGWEDWGWSKHNDVPNGSARIDLSNWGGWILVHSNLSGTWGAFVFRYKAPADFGDFLVVHVEGPNRSDFPRVRISEPYVKKSSDGWNDVYVPISRLNPDEHDFDRVVFSTNRSVPPGWVEFDSIGLTKGVAGVAKRATAVTRNASAIVQCTGPATGINPMIYGIAIDIMHDAKDVHQWQLGATARRWGGNPASRYNWELGNAWNTAQDWFFENVNFSGEPGYSYRTFLKDNHAHNVMTALTIPMLDWVAKDTKSCSFPRSIYPDQAQFDQWRPEAGNGTSKSGKPIAAGPPARTSIKNDPAYIRRWVETIRREDALLGYRSVHQYILDNEPALWNSTHRDVHPDPVTYDELLERTIAFGTAIRQADPDAVIAGPAEWGWPNYFYSAKDMAVGHTLKPDRRAHGDVPLLTYYLTKLREHEAKTGVRILDVLDLHFYPQGKGVYSADAARETAALRLRQTRGLWDPTYRDESWVADSIRLLPRAREWIDQNYPGRGFSIGEWSFGAEQDMSGALAVAEALGRFGQYGVTSAFYWTYPPQNSPAYWAFRAYRNFDGRGGAFEEQSVPVTTSGSTSVFASRNRSGQHWVLVALNLDPNDVARLKIELKGCGSPSEGNAFTYRGGAAGFTRAELAPIEPGFLTVSLVPYSITVLDFKVGVGGAAGRAPSTTSR